LGAGRAQADLLAAGEGGLGEVGGLLFELLLAGRAGEERDDEQDQEADRRLLDQRRRGAVGGDLEGEAAALAAGVPDDRVDPASLDRCGSRATRAPSAGRAGADATALWFES